MRLDMTVSCDERFRPLLDQLVSRMIAYVGYDGPDATAVAGVVERAIGGARACMAGTPNASLDLRFVVCETEMEIRIGCRPAPGAARRAEARPLDRVLREGGAGEDAPLDRIQQVMTRVEFGREDGLDVCTLAKALPGRG
jgi:hypothetical protein